MPVAAAVLLVVLLAAQRRRQASAAPSPDLIAVAPFDALDPTLELWRDGMTDVLSRYLDGAGPLRTVAPSTVIRQWRGRADRASAEALSRRVGAGVVIVGDLTPTSRDSVRLRATVVTATGGQGEDVEVRGPADRIGELADSLGRSILIVLGRHRPIGAVAGAPITGTTLPALKAFLQGEQFYRRGLYDSALVHFQRASDADTTFALAYQRMVVTLWFSPRTAGAYRAVEYYAARALRALGSLAGRDSLLIVGVNCLVGLEADGARPGGEASRFRCADSTARAAVKRFPGDPESWYLLGEVYTHMSVLMGGTVDDEFAMYQRALDLDSTFTPAYEHAIGLALETGRPELALRYVTTAATQARQDPRSARYTLVLTLLDPATARTPAAESLLANATATELWDALADLRQSEDSGEAAVRLARSLWSQPHDPSGAPDWVVDSVQQRRTLATMLARRGRLREASDLVHLDTPDGFQNPYSGLAALKMVPASDVDAAMRRMSRARPSATWYYNVNRWTRELAWWRERGDSSELLRLATRLVQAPPGLSPATGLRLAREARAYVRLLAADSASALEQLASLPDSTCLDSESCAEPRLLLARLLVAQGRLEEGARVMDQWIGQADEELGPLLWLERAHLAERLRDREKALRQYARVVAAWRSADPSLQPYLADAREGLRRLTEERSGESR